MSITPVDLLEEADQELTRIHGRVLTALAHLKLEKRQNLILKVPTKENSLPSIEVIRQFLVTTVLPPLVGALTTWIFTSVHFLSIFHISADQTAKAITEVAVFGISAGLAWLASHNVLKGLYTPAAKAKAGK